MMTDVQSGMGCSGLWLDMCRERTGVKLKKLEQMQSCRQTETVRTSS